MMHHLMFVLRTSKADDVFTQLELIALSHSLKCLTPPRVWLITVPIGNLSSVSEICVTPTALDLRHELRSPYCTSTTLADS